MVIKWNEVSIGECFEFKNGLNKEKAFFGYGTPIINYTDVYKQRSIYFKDIKGKVDLSKDEIKRFLVQKNDVFFTRTSETPEEVGLTSVLLEEIDNCVFSGFILRARPKNSTLLPIYCKYCFSTQHVRNYIKASCTYTTRALTNGTQLSLLMLPVPPKEEQQRIAEALSDIDELIFSLEKLIEKKKAVKQGTMQDLLTGKKRLPGFSGEWETKKLKAFISSFIVPMRDKPPKLNGYIPWCRIEDFEGKYLYKSKTNQGVDINTIQKMNLKVFPVNTLLVSCSANLGRCAIVKKELITNQTFIGLVPHEDLVDVEFLYYKMCGEEKALNDLSSGTTISYLSREHFEDYIVFVPSNICEQKAISDILSNMDNEIDALEKRLAKYRKIKQGMMQQLLTGQIRLV